jgi:hypothetical protein
MADVDTLTSAHFSLLTPPFETLETSLQFLLQRECLGTSDGARGAGSGKRQHFESLTVQLLPLCLSRASLPLNSCFEVARLTRKQKKP